MAKVCPRGGRHPMRRKKNCLLLLLAAASCLYLLHVLGLHGDGYTPLQPLSDARSEAKRLLRFITHYHCQCNATLQIGNRSHWPICVDRDVGLDVDLKDGKVAYSIGSHGDYLVEKELALNHSFEVILIHHDKISPFTTSINNTKVIQTVVVPNDPADFSRNLYGQQTVNDIFRSLGHQRIDVLRLGSTSNSNHMWEILHFMIEDSFLQNVQQLHVAMYIDKIEDDFLYNWYRVLYELFYKQGLRLYHTSSADSLCLQVTMMESCTYYMSFVRNPGPRVFVLHPPADYGTSELEEERLLAHVSAVTTECHQQIVGGVNDRQLTFTSPGQPSWQLCANDRRSLFPKPCSVFRFRLANDHSLEQRFIQEGCSVHTVTPASLGSQPARAFKMHGHYPDAARKAGLAESGGSEWLVSSLSSHGAISLLEVDAPGHEWHVLAQLLDAGLLANVTQLVGHFALPHAVHGRHDTVLRARYSQLRRLEDFGFQLFSSVADPGPSDSCCFTLGFVRKPGTLR